NAARRGLAQPCNHFSQLSLSIAVHPADADNLSGTDSEADMLKDRRAASVARIRSGKPQDFLTLILIAKAARKIYLTAYHHTHEFVLGHILGWLAAHGLAIAQNRNRV